MLTVLDLFSGIGGFSLGLERTGGFKTIAFCEIDPFCRKVLAKHWPGVPVYEDVRTLAGELGFADIICGGFPCQDVSRAGHREGLGGARSGLWSEYVRLIRVIRPRYVIVENVSDLLSLGMGTVLGDLAESGYDAEWDCLPAASVGAPHIRDRVWILAYPDRSMGDLRGGMMREHDATTCFRKETTGHRPSGAKIGSSLRWCPEFIREWLRTGGDLNPEWIEVLMGFPIKWSEIAPSGTQSSRKSRKSSAAPSLKRSA